MTKDINSLKNLIASPTLPLDKSTHLGMCKQLAEMQYLQGAITEDELDEVVAIIDKRMEEL